MIEDLECAWMSGANSIIFGFENDAYKGSWTSWHTNKLFQAPTHQTKTDIKLVLMKPAHFDEHTLIDITWASDISSAMLAKKVNSHVLLCWQ